MCVCVCVCVFVCMYICIIIIIIIISSFILFLISSLISHFTLLVIVLFKFVVATIAVQYVSHQRQISDLGDLGSNPES